VKANMFLDWLLLATQISKQRKRMIPVRGYAAQQAKGLLAPYSFEYKEKFRVFYGSFVKIASVRVMFLFMLI
jgi:hypothetical protein